MVATNAGRRKRGAGGAVLDEDAAPSFSGVVPPLNTKRGRCSPLAAAVEDLGVSLEFDPVDALQLLFPDADPELLRGSLEATGNVLDAAIRNFKDSLASGSETISADAASSGATSDVRVMNTPTNSTEWAELIFKEISSSSDLNDTKNRAFRILELFVKSTESCNTRDEEQKMREEHKILKHMVGGLLRQAGILKRGFLIQHKRLKDYQEERSQFKETVDKYQQEIKALKDRNYILSFHLEQSNKVSSSTFGPRNPDVF